MIDSENVVELVNDQDDIEFGDFDEISLDMRDIARLLGELHH